MRTIAMGRLLRMLRLRKDWRQVDVAAKAGLSPSAIGRHERGWSGSVTALERHAAVFDLRVDVRLIGRGGELARLADEEHAAIIESLAAWFRKHGFVTEAEASFSEWGERGRIDLPVFDPRTGTLVIVEVKTHLVDLQDLFGTLDVKTRLSSTIAKRRGWHVRRNVTLLALADTSANRTIVRRHRTLFEVFEHRRLAVSAIGRDGARVLHWVPPASASRSSWIGGRQRVRRDSGQSSSAGAYEPIEPEEGPGPTSTAIH